MQPLLVTSGRRQVMTKLSEPRITYAIMTCPSYEAVLLIVCRPWETTWISRVTVVTAIVITASTFISRLHILPTTAEK